MMSKIWMQAILLLLVMTTSACNSTWKEEALLHDRSILVVERSVDRGGRHEIGQSPPIKSQTLSFTLPGTNEKVKWVDEYAENLGASNFLPLLLDVKNNIAYLAVYPMGTLSYNKWGRPNPPYVFFKYKEERWEQIQIEEFPAEFTTPNLIFSQPDVTAKKLGANTISSKAISDLYASYKQPAYRKIIRVPLDAGNLRRLTGDTGLIPTTDGGWLGKDWFSNQASLEQCLKFCDIKKVGSNNCPCTTLFKDK